MSGNGEGAAPSSFGAEMEMRRAEVYREDGELVYFRCALCGNGVPDPVSLYGGPQFFPHRRETGRGDRCQARMIAIPDPMRANHELILLGRDEDADPILQVLIRSTDNLRRMLAGVLVHKAGS